ncbi:MAG: hypothetical protein M3506_07445 [Chloroflexota bacterium]|nr:hypothetical protein [Chloroflexota bacterium]
MLGGNKLEMVVVHDLTNKPHQRLEQLQRDRVIREKLVLNYGMFRSTNGASSKARNGGAGTGSNHGASPQSTDVEDLFAPASYLGFFNGAFAKQLNGVKVTEGDLLPGERIVERIGRYLRDKRIELRPSGGFNHYTVANYVAINPPKKWDKDTLARFEALFTRVNSLLSD